MKSQESRELGTPKENPQVGERREMGNAQTSQKHPPHVTENDEDAPVQDELPSPDAAPVLPATAGGKDTLPPEAQDIPINEESMYEQRRDEDKDRPPTTRPS